MEKRRQGMEKLRAARKAAGLPWFGGAPRKGWRYATVAKALRAVQSAVREAGPDLLGKKLTRHVDAGLDLSARIVEKAAAIERKYKIDEAPEGNDLQFMRLASENIWKSAAILERVGAAALAASSGGQEKLDAILKSLKDLQKKGKPKQ